MHMPYNHQPAQGTYSTVPASQEASSCCFPVGSPTQPSNYYSIILTGFAAILKQT